MAPNCRVRCLAVQCDPRMKKKERDRMFAAAQARAQAPTSPRVPPGKRIVESMVDEMKDGSEYASLIDVVPEAYNARDQIRRTLAELEAVRKRPALVYAANVLRQQTDVPSSILLTDDLPFAEMVAAVPASEKSIDIVLVTPGGVAQQVSQFVHRLRPRFDRVAFILPHMALSAGTIWALSGNEIWMDERAFIGPIDPQVPGKDGRLLPAQALLTYLNDAQSRATDRQKNGMGPAWTDVQLLRSIDAKEIGNAVAASQYSIQLAANYLENYKFADWVTHSNGQPVTPAERRQAAIAAASKLCSHDQWKTHSHGISRDVAWSELRIKIGQPESVAGFHRALRRLWALVYWTFENTVVVKMLLSQNYALFRNQPKEGTK